MTGVRLAADIIVRGFFLLILLGLIAFDSYFGGKDRKVTIKNIFISIGLVLLINIVGAPLLEPVSNRFSSFMTRCVDWVASGFQAVADFFDDLGDSANAGRNPETDGAETGEQSNDPASGLSDENRVIEAGDGRNRILYYSNAPLEKRALVPDGSRYPDVTMEAVLSADVVRSSTLGYDGESRGYLGGATYAFTAPVSDPDGLYEELVAEILKNPVVGDMIVRGLADVYPGFEEEPALSSFLTACNDAFEGGQEREGMNAWVAGYQFADGQEQFYVTDSYRMYAESLCQVLDTFTNYGVREFTCDAFYTLRIVALTAEMRTDPMMDSLMVPALVLYKTNDSGDVVCVVGFDLNDKGLLLYSPNVIR